MVRKQGLPTTAFRSVLAVLHGTERVTKARVFTLHGVHSSITAHWWLLWLMLTLGTIREKEGAVE